MSIKVRRTNVDGYNELSITMTPDEAIILLRGLSAAHMLVLDNVTARNPLKPEQREPLRKLEELVQLLSTWRVGR